MMMGDKLFFGHAPSAATVLCHMVEPGRERIRRCAYDNCRVNQARARIVVVNKADGERLAPHGKGRFHIPPREPFAVYIDNFHCFGLSIVNG